MDILQLVIMMILLELYIGLKVSPTINVIMMSLTVESGMWDFYSFDPPEEMDPVL